jgi:hypothetical protein
MLRQLRRQRKQRENLSVSSVALCSIFAMLGVHTMDNYLAQLPASERLVLVQDLWDGCNLCEAVNTGIFEVDLL